MIILYIYIVLARVLNNYKIADIYYKGLQYIKIIYKVYSVNKFKKYYVIQ
jgi:hypothetical protein